jgi:hypothetical protein
VRFSALVRRGLRAVDNPGIGGQMKALAEKVEKASTWNQFEWEEWVPAEVRLDIIEFWKATGPNEWLKDFVKAMDFYGVPVYGKVATFYNIYDKLVTGRFIHCWRNIGRVIMEDGSCHCVCCHKYYNPMRFDAP